MILTFHRDKKKRIKLAIFLKMLRSKVAPRVQHFSGFHCNCFYSCVHVATHDYLCMVTSCHACLPSPIHTYILTRVLTLCHACLIPVIMCLPIATHAYIPPAVHSYMYVHTSTHAYLLSYVLSTATCLPPNVCT